MEHHSSSKFSAKELEAAIEREGQEFKEHYLWLEAQMPSQFFDKVTQAQLMLIAHSLSNFYEQGCYTEIQISGGKIVLSLDNPDSDIEVLKPLTRVGVKNYGSYLSKENIPVEQVTAKLKITLVSFSDVDGSQHSETPITYSDKEKEDLLKRLDDLDVSVTKNELDTILASISHRFIKSLSNERLAIALYLFLRAQSRDHCQYEVQYNENWEQSDATIDSSMQIILAWRNTPKHQLLFHLAKMIFRHKLKMTYVNAAYVDQFGESSILMMSIGINSIEGKAAWEVADISDLLKELVSSKYSTDLPMITEHLVDTNMITGNMGNVVKSMVYFVHQALLQCNPNVYTLEKVTEGFVRHPELTKEICELFRLKFDPNKVNITEYQEKKRLLSSHILQLDTGQHSNDVRRKNILTQGMQFVDFCDKTNVYRNNKSAFAFRLRCGYLDTLPFERQKRFPSLPFSVFYVKGMDFIGFHIRFEDLCRGGLRTILPQRQEQADAERDNIFFECYNLAYTQHKKNKDIPEGGSKGVIFVDYLRSLDRAKKIYEKELSTAEFDQNRIQSLLDEYVVQQRNVYLYQSQRAYVHSILTLVNCFEDGTLKAKDVIDYYKKPEYLYLGPDENMHNSMLEWIAEYSERTGYEPKKAFISSKPRTGINHKEYGVTSLGVNVYMHEVLLHLGIDPTREAFTIKISGGPDGDVAGNQILNLKNHYPNTAKLLALTDISGTIYDPNGLDLDAMASLFHEGKSIRYYPVDLLTSGGFLLDLQSKRDDTKFTRQTLLWRREGTDLIQDWISGNDMHHLYRNNVHQTITDIFIPAGGRPRTLNQDNYTDFLDSSGRPTSKAIIEGANLYLTQEARLALEEKGVLIIKDSSANKGGVICSSCEVLTGLLLEDEEFISEKDIIMTDILDFIRDKALKEAQLMLKSHRLNHGSLVMLSEEISKKINTYMYDLLSYFKTIELSNDLSDPLIKCLLLYCPTFIREQHKDRLLSHIPDIHKKSIIATYIASKLVYEYGVDWEPSIVNVLPAILSDSKIL